MKQSTKSDRIGFREDAEIKRKASIILNSMGLDISSACRMLLRQIVRTHTIPFQLESGYTAKGERRVLEADAQLSRDLKRQKAKRFSNPKKLLDSLE